VDREAAGMLLAQPLLDAAQCRPSDLLPLCIVADRVRRREVMMKSGLFLKS
jgi:hypothetical protein